MKKAYFLFFALLCKLCFSKESEKIFTAHSLIQTNRHLEAQLHALESKLENREKNRSRRFTDSPFMIQGRLTLEAGVPISTSPQSNITTLRFTPYQGNRVALYNGTVWVFRTFSEITLTLSGLSNNTNYDIFIYDNSGTVAIDTPVAWTDNVTRVALTTQDQVLVKTGATTRRYVGTIRITTSNQTQDTLTQRFVWNYYHRVPRLLQLSETTDNWASTANAIRSANNTATNRVEYVVGADDIVTEGKTLLVIEGNATLRTNTFSSLGDGDTTTAISDSMRGGAAINTIRLQTWSQLNHILGLGYHELDWIETRGNTGSGNVTYYGDDGGDDRVRSGLYATIEG